VVFDPETQVNVWMFGRKTWERRFRDVGRELIKAAVAVNGLRIMDELPVVGISFDIDNPRAKAWITRKVFKFAYEVNQTTEQQLRSAILDSLAAGDAVPAIKKAVERIFGYAEGYRNERIARTETIGATNYGAFEAIKQSGLKCKKEWVATLDERTRDRHAEMDGETAELDQPFSNGLMFPGDPDGPPEEIINCRCTEVHIFPEDDE
jgi:SPP1 gp7 family putative phage head morphogenesis protein